ncbi:hypothetical protein [Methylocystis echinoides]|uniref:Uncharacterized protein n=1 Tax=Methylocystis echinoides TaxID=29468 RepID=A0A9W6GYB2_9HYPH|nr:hypothetical protein [Methylocystis echinoides]GLI95237.1 hypothetical protein LMG27198_42290 [Methylocystis echinoides]
MRQPDGHILDHIQTPGVEFLHVGFKFAPLAQIMSETNEEALSGAILA